MVFIKKNKFIFLYLVVALLSFNSLVKAQTIEAGITGGGAYLLTDSVKAVPFEQPGWSIGVITRYNFNSRWSARLSYNYMNFKNVAPYSDTVNINDISLIGEFNFFDYATGSEHNIFSPYLFGGVSGFIYKRYPLDNLGNVDLSKNKEIKFNGALTFGVGFKYSLSERLGLGLEWGMRKTFTDRLDNNDLNGTFFYGSDWYNYTGLSITYKFYILKSGTCK